MKNSNIKYIQYRSNIDIFLVDNKVIDIRYGFMKSNELFPNEKHIKEYIYLYESRDLPEDKIDYISNKFPEYFI